MRYQQSIKCPGSCSRIFSGSKSPANVNTPTQQVLQLRKKRAWLSSKRWFLWWRSSWKKLPSEQYYAPAFVRNRFYFYYVFIVFNAHSSSPTDSPQWMRYIQQQANAFASVYQEIRSFHWFMKRYHKKRNSYLQKWAAPWCILENATISQSTFCLSLIEDTTA